MAKIKKILVANRGEIALRIMKTCKKLGISTVAIFSEADRNSKVVRFADEAVCVGPPPSSASYLLGDKIIEICKALDVDAIHPGYGFLSENATFAKNVTNAGIIFIGPSPESIEVMGDKLSAKHAVAQYNIPMVPGTEDAITDIPKAKTLASEIGYPILIKASAGGGGKGMRIVEKEADFEEQMNLAISEAISAFGNGAVFIEKYIGSPKHIEMQILGDKHGNVIHLFERECSVQRRHQKVIEEAPSPVVSDEMRERMGKDAINVAKACNYYGAGTVEFIVDENLNYYFLEMNTRLQVEHPVTEEITGVDLVEEMISIAEGNELSITQKDLKIKGHSIELRVYAEDPKNDFLPDIGTLETYKTPIGEGVRVDDVFEQGMDIPIYYDPMIAKLTVWGKNRNEAIQRMIEAIKAYKIKGIETTLPFGAFAINHEEFRSGRFDTHFVKKYFSPEMLENKDEEEVAALFSALLYNDAKITNNSYAETTNWQKNR